MQLQLARPVGADYFPGLQCMRISNLTDPQFSWGFNLPLDCINLAAIYPLAENVNPGACRHDASMKVKISHGKVGQVFRNVERQASLLETQTRVRRFFLRM